MTQELTDRIFKAQFSGRLSPREAIVLRVLAAEGDGRMGREQALPGKEIRKRAERMGIKMDRRALAEAVQQLMLVHHIPIGTSKGSPAGYFISITDHEMERAADELVKQGIAMLRRARVLSPRSRYGREMLGQLSAEFSAEGA